MIPHAPTEESLCQIKQNTQPTKQSERRRNVHDDIARGTHFFLFIFCFLLNSDQMGIQFKKRDNSQLVIGRCWSLFLSDDFTTIHLDCTFLIRIPIRSKKKYKKNNYIFRFFVSLLLRSRRRRNHWFFFLSSLYALLYYFFILRFRRIFLGCNFTLSVCEV